jgi:hypothetical protein
MENNNNSSSTGNTVNTIEYKDVRLDSSEVIAPHNVISDYNQAKNIIDILERDQYNRNKAYTLIEGLKGGKAPIPKEELDKKGLGYLSNTNWRDFKAESKKVCQSFKNATSGRFLVDFKTFLFDSKTNAIISQKISKTISEHFKRDGNFQYKKNLLITEMVDFGCCGVIFNDRKGKDFYVVPPSNILFPPEAPACVDMMPYIAIGHELSPDYLWKVYEGLSNKNTTGWKKEVLGEFLYKTSNLFSEELQYTASWSHAFSMKVRNKETTYGSLYSGNIKVFSLLVREYDGQYSRILLSKSNAINDFIYFKSKEFKKIEDYIQIFFLENGVRYAKDVKGLGQDTYSSFQQLNKIKNNFINTFSMGATSFIENNGGGVDNLKSFKLVTSGVNILPTGLKIPQFANVPQINYLIPGIQLVKDSITKSNIYLESNQLPKSDDVRGIPGYTPDFNASVRASKENIEFFLEQLDLFWYVLISKVLSDKDSDLRKEVDTILEKIDPRISSSLFKKDSPSDNRLADHIEIKSSRIITKGNVLLDQASLDNIAAISGQLSEEKQRAFLKLMMDQWADENFSDYLLPEEDMQPSSSYSVTMATVVANQLSKGEKVIWSKDLNHEIFGKVLLDKCTEIIGTYNEAEDKIILLQETASALTSLVEFLAPSIQYLKRDRTKKEVNEYFNQRFYQIVGYANGIVANAQTQQKAIARKQVELDMAGSGNPEDPRVLEILINAKLKELKIKQDGQAQMFKELESQKIRFALNNAEIQYKNELSSRELDIKAELGYKKLQDDKVIGIFKEINGVKG